MGKRVGITVLGILVILGSLLTLAISFFMAFGAFFLSSPPAANFPPEFFKLILLVLSLMYGLPAILGIFSGVGVIRRKNWARVSVIVFSILLIIFSGIGILMTFSVVSSASRPELDDAEFRLFMTAFWSIPLAAGAWWAIYLTRPGVRRQFASPVLANPLQEGLKPNNFVSSAADLPSRSQCPLSIAIVAWLLLVFSLGVPLMLVLHMPAFLFFTVLTGLNASFYYVIFGAFSVAIGIMLLRLNAFAWPLAVTFLSVSLLSGLWSSVAPGREARMKKATDSINSTFPWMRTIGEQDKRSGNDSEWIEGTIATLLTEGLPLYFLLTRKKAFYEAVAAKAAQEAGL